MLSFSQLTLSEANGMIHDIQFLFQNKSIVDDTRRSAANCYPI